MSSVASMDRHPPVSTISVVAKAAHIFEVPVVLSTLNVKTGLSDSTLDMQGSSLRTPQLIFQGSLPASLILASYPSPPAIFPMSEAGKAQELSETGERLYRSLYRVVPCRVENNLRIRKEGGISYG